MEMDRPDEMGEADERAWQRAERMVARRFGLRLARVGQETFDATYPDGRTVQIKTRKVWRFEESTSFDHRNLGKRYDELIVVLIHRQTGAILGGAWMEYSVACEHERPAHNHRVSWNRKIRRDPRVRLMTPDDFTEQPHD